MQICDFELWTWTLSIRHELFMMDKLEDALPHGDELTERRPDDWGDQFTVGTKVLGGRVDWEGRLDWEGTRLLLTQRQLCQYNIQCIYGGKIDDDIDQQQPTIIDVYDG